MLVSMKAVLDLADAKKIAVGAFNITSLEGIQAVLGAAKELGQPVILQFAPVHESVIPCLLYTSEGNGKHFQKQVEAGLKI